MVPSPRLELDPNGDIELILACPNEQKLQWSSDMQKSIKDKKHKKKEKKALRIARQPAVEEDPRIQEPTSEELDSNVNTELRMLVSSKHLCLASSTFEKMLNGPYLESLRDNGQIREVRTTEWDAPAFLLVQDMIHGYNNLVPSSVSVEMLAKVAAIVDYYNCHDVAEPFVNRWIQDLQIDIPSSYGKKCMLWMSISWVFLRVDILQNMAVLAVKGCETSVETMGLPVPVALTRIITEKQREVTTEILLRINNLWESLCQQTVCDSGCTDIRLGSLTRQMHEAGIPFTTMNRDPYSVSIDQLQGKISAFVSPPSLRRLCWGCLSRSLEDEIKLCLDKSLDLLEGSWLNDVWSRRIQEKEALQAGLSASRAAWRTD